ncbi:PAS domain S-box-containing protein [Puniceibacterium sediminis]|uniref:histidine kinase n=2 Tax=Puniceibacterium sediminis TaxID=1608407 RepID=A0A238XNB3_9RHOB|nr:PAS domain S-box-containing protein [Puniceibacterium sediminis]
MIGVFMNLAIPAVGLAVSYLRPLQNWPNIPKTEIGYLVAGFSVLHILPLLFLAGTIESGNPYATFAPIALGFIVSGALSILVTWQIVNFAIRAANNTNQTAEMARRLDLAMRASGVGLFVQEVGEPGPYYDAGMIAMLGLNREPGMVPYSELEPLFHPDDLKRVREEMRNAWTEGQLRGKSDFRAIRKDGTLQFIRTTWVTELDAKGSVKRVTGINSDMTDIRDAEHQARNSRERLALIAEKLPGAFVDYDITEWDKPKLMYISPKCVDIWGYTDEDLLANPSLLAQMHDPKDLGPFLKAVKRASETISPIHYRYMITSRDGHSRWLDFHGDFATEDGRTLVKAIVLDATREVQLQQKMEKEREISRRAQKNESIGQLTGGVAHDFNNLLAVILGNLELLRDDEKPSAQKDMIDAAISATLRGADLTKNMLAFARQAPLTPVVLDLNNVVREAKNWMARAMPESVEIETSLLAGLWPIEADRSSLESALLNLALNARDAMNGHGKLTIETANVRIDETYLDMRQEEMAPGRYVMLAVSDNGPGIAADVIGSIFEPFFTTKPPGVGSGLGLSMTVGFMKQSAGTVQVYTETGEGTTFKLYFPVSKSELEEPVKPLLDDNQASGRGKKILVAEDEDAVRATLVTILELAGYHVTATVSGDMAFTAFEANPSFDLLLTDIVMPGKLQGTGLAKALRERWPSLPIIFMSGYASEATVHGNGLRPEDIRLMKPVQRAELLAAVVKAAGSIKR